MKNTLNQLKVIAALLGMEIRNAEAPDEFHLIDSDGGEVGNGDNDWTLGDIYSFFNELIEHPEAKGMVVVS